jgi:hypothetical protein
MHSPSVPRSRRAALPLLLLALVTTLATPTAAAPATQVIVLPGAGSAEGIAAGRGASFYAGDLFAGDIFHGNLQRGTAERFIDAPRAAWPWPWPPTSPTSFVNDVSITQDGAWLTDSPQARLYFIPVSAAGVPRPPRTLTLSGRRPTPAATSTSTASPPRPTARP